VGNAAGADVDELMTEFYAINAIVPIEQRVNGLYILDSASVGWCFKKADDRPDLFWRVAHPAEAPSDPMVCIARSGRDTLYEMFEILWSTLARTQLVAPDFTNNYGVQKIRSRLRVLHPKVEESDD
jgi:hypothetical protein